MGSKNVIEPQRKWREQNGIIYFSVTSNGMTGEEWITHLEAKGIRIDDFAKSTLRSPEFKPTNGVTTEIAVLGGALFNDKGIIRNIRAFVALRKLGALNTEVACLIRNMFTDEDIEAMGFWWIVAMHEPINDYQGVPRLLFARRGGEGRELCTCHVSPDVWLGCDCSFAFAVL